MTDLITDVMKYLTFFSIILLISCSSNEKEIQKESKNVADSLASIAKYSNKIIGSWKAVTISVDVKADSAYQFFVAAGQWEEKLGFKPFKTTFRKNNTYQIDFPNLTDSIIDSRRGIWNVFSDTLYMIENDATYMNNIRFKSNHIEFKTLVDWDNDGRINDVFTQVDKKIE